VYAGKNPKRHENMQLNQSANNFELLLVPESDPAPVPGYVAIWEGTVLYIYLGLDSERWGTVTKYI
jgi:hypothetical protein